MIINSGDLTSRINASNNISQHDLKHETAFFYDYKKSELDTAIEVEATSKNCSSNLADNNITGNNEHFGFVSLC